ncbi:MAG TPA: hypothetical protein VM662_08255 [Sphingomonas sp.]|nr:hypothetical protein [Sphingomonas sp.]
MTSRSLPVATTAGAGAPVAAIAQHCGLGCRVRSRLDDEALAPG